ncbi:MAG: YoaK family protein [Pseudobdellovibrionaceae bacterium]
MLYGNESISHYTKSNISIWMLMAFQAGLLNIGGFMACQRFVSHVTGFATFFGYDISRGHPKHALGMLVVPLFFILGAMLSGQLVDLRLKLHKKPKYYITFGVIFFLTLFVAVAGMLGRLGEFGEPLESSENYTLLILLCFTCGIQNGTITTVSKSVIRTTHLTGISTDLGIGLVRLLNRHKLGDHVNNEKKATLMRIGIIFFFGLGSVVGGFAFARFGHGAFLIPAITSGILFWTMIYFQVWNQPKVEDLPYKKQPLP